MSDESDQDYDSRSDEEKRSWQKFLGLSDPETKAWFAASRASNLEAERLRKLEAQRKAERDAEDARIREYLLQQSAQLHGSPIPGQTATGPVEPTSPVENLSPDLAEKAKKPPPPPADGPCGNNQWRHDGKVLDGEMTNKPYRLASYLYERLGRKITISDVISEGRDLIGDARIFGNVQEASVQRHGSNISKWFAVRNVPLIVGSGEGRIWMERSRH